MPSPLLSVTGLVKHYEKSRSLAERLLGKPRTRVQRGQQRESDDRAR